MAVGDLNDSGASEALQSFGKLRKVLSNHESHAAATLNPHD